MADQEDNCSICLNIFTEPKIIDCGHIFCGDCLEDYYTKKCSKSKNFPCPLCRHNVDVPEGGIKMFPSTYSKKRKIDRESAAGPSTSPTSIEREIIDAVTGVFSCDACKSRDNDIYKCIECDKYMCCSCKNTHHDKFCADHHLFIVQHQDKQTRRSKRHCTQHTMEKIEFYCKDCNLAVCKTCLTPAHRDHDTLGIYDYWDEAEDELKKLKDDLEIKSSEFEIYVVEVNKKIDTMNRSAQTSCNKIDQHVKQICDVVIRRGEKLKKDLKEVLKEDEQKMTKIVDDTKDLIGRMDKMVLNISDILINDCVNDMVDILSVMKRQRDELRSRDLVSLQDVRSEHHTMGVNSKSLHNVVGEFRVARRTKSTLEYSFNYDVMCNKEDAWVYSHDFKLQGCSWNIRAKHTPAKLIPNVPCHPIGFDYAARDLHLKKTPNTHCSTEYPPGLFGSRPTKAYVDIGLYVNVGDSVNKSTVTNCTVNATMKMTYVPCNKRQEETETTTSEKKFTPPIGVLKCKTVHPSPERSIACTATVDITMTTVIY